MNALSNYPPGVNGSEWQIAGPKELTVVRECEGTEARVYPAYLVDQLLTSKSSYPFNALNGTAVETEYDCTFSGQVDAEVYDYELLWTCPTCGHEHAEQWGGPEEFDEPNESWDGLDEYDEPDDVYFGSDN